MKYQKPLRAVADRLHDADKDYKRVSNREFLVYIAIVLIVAFSVRLFVFEPVLVVGDSMYDTLLDGERMFVEKLTYMVEAPKRGDIIICFYPEHTQTCVKRVMGVGGDIISITDGVVFVNGEPLDESLYWNDYIYGDMAAQKVPDNSVFVMGDNRNYSSDSRRSDVGAIPLCRVVGKVKSVIYPFDAYREFA